MTIAQAIPPLTVINRGGALIQDRALNQANTVTLMLLVANLPIQNDAKT